MIRLMLALQHRLNPLHLFCRLIEKGWNKDCSMFACKWYEILIYSWLHWISIAVIKLHMIGSRKVNRCIEEILYFLAILLVGTSEIFLLLWYPSF